VGVTDDVAEEISFLSHCTVVFFCRSDLWRKEFEMPGGDRTGPRGGSPKTGRGLGYCADSDQPGYAAPQSSQGLGLAFRWGGRGRRRGYGRGRGWRAEFRPVRGRGAYVVSNDTQDQEIDLLKTQAEDLGNTLQELQVRLSALESEDKEKE
jgi:hypothetical protein